MPLGNPDANGVYSVNPGIYQANPTEKSVTVASSSGGTKLLDANPDRTGLEIQNQSSSVSIYVARDGGEPVADGTCRIVSAGASLDNRTGPIPKGEVWAIAASSTVVVNVVEFS